MTSTPLFYFYLLSAINIIGPPSGGDRVVFPAIGSDWQYFVWSWQRPPRYGAGESADVMLISNP